MSGKLSFYRRAAQLGTRLKTWLAGVYVGQDEGGNRYYRSRGKGPETRWVLYAGEPDPTTVPPDWFGWLHYSCDLPLPSGGAQGYFWLRPHQPNLSGTSAAYLPSGAGLSRLSKRYMSKAAADPRVWRPTNEE